jgi:hypothetical protein
MSASEVAVVSVSCPGGMARQFRVQVPDPATSSHWRQVGTFCRPADARQLLEQLSRTGVAARIVECRSLPTAA